MSLKEKYRDFKIFLLLSTFNWTSVVMLFLFSQVHVSWIYLSMGFAIATTIFSFITYYDYKNAQRKEKIGN